MQELILFIMSFIFIFILYELFIVSRAKKNYKDKKDDKMPIEVKYLISRYKLDLKKIKYDQLLQMVALVSSLDISIIVSLTVLFDSFILQVVVILVLVAPLILVSYHFVGVFYKKKGMIKDV